MHILILGAGAVGGYFGARLIEAGADVTFLVRPRRAEQLARNGLVVESSFGDFSRQVATVTSGADCAPPDIVVIACKAYGLDGALRAISPHVGPETIILPLLNGIAHLETIERSLPNAIVWGGLVHIGVALTPDGVIKHLNELQLFIFGPRDGVPRPSAEQLRAAFAGTPVDAQLSPNILQDLWDKLVFLATLAGCTCLMRADIGTILKTTHGERLILGLLDECRAIAEAEGFPPDADRIACYRQRLTERGSTFTASMLRDIEGGRPIEADHIIGDMVSKAIKHGIPTPLLNVAYAHLQAYEARRPTFEG